MSTKFSDSILRWYEKNGRKRLPWKVKDPYKIWISEIMLQQTQVATVIPYYNKFVDTYPDLPSLSKASLDELMLLWSGLGYYRRIKNIYLAAQIISNKYNNTFPRDYEAILSLPGIPDFGFGPKPQSESKSKTVISNIPFDLLDIDRASFTTL